MYMHHDNNIHNCGVLAGLYSNYLNITTNNYIRQCEQGLQVVQQCKVCQARLVLCSLDGERRVGSDDSSVLARFANWKRTTNCCVSTFAGSSSVT